MNHPDFTRLRRRIDEAITLGDLESASDSAREGLSLAEKKECPGERMYFHAQLAVIGERYEEAILWLRKALVFNPMDGAAYNDIALCRIELGETDDALELFNKGIAVEPDYATIHHNKGWFLSKLGRHEEAMESLRRALEIEPDRAVTYENLANAFERLGLFDEALAAYRKALVLIRRSSRRISRQIEEEVVRLERRKEKENGNA